MEETNLSSIYNIGCLDAEDVVTYRYKGVNYIESFESMWKRLSMGLDSEVEEGEDKASYIVVKDVEVYDSVEKDFVTVQKVVRKVTSGWSDLRFSNGRVLRCSGSYPFETVNRGIVFANDLCSSDIINVNKYIDLGSSSYYSMKEIKKAWMYGVSLRNSYCLDNLFGIKLLSNKVKVLKQFNNYASELYDLTESGIVSVDDGSSGNYMLLSLESSELVHEYKRESVNNRLIPPYIWNSSRDIRLSFLAGIVDSGSYVDINGNNAKIQVCIDTKELALQVMYLVQSLGYCCRVYKNYYSSDDLNKVIYICEFDSFSDLNYFMIETMKCCNIDRVANQSLQTYDTISITDKINLSYEDYGYSLVTDSGHFDVSGIYVCDCEVV